MRTLKNPPNSLEREALKAATEAAEAAHDAILRKAAATATMHVYDDVISAAATAYRDAGGQRRIVVRGHGNATHPVGSISVGILRRDCE